MPPWSAVKTKVQLRLSVQRLRVLQTQKEAHAKGSRRDIAMLLERGKNETARVKVENIINEDIHVELLELLELYCELLLARFGLLDQNLREPDPGIVEAVCAVIYAAPRTEIKELHILRDILMHKWGREFALGVMENKTNCVPDRVAKKITNAMPSTELVDAYMGEISKAYGVKWEAPVPAQPPALEDTVSDLDKEIPEAAPESSDSYVADLPDKSAGKQDAPVDTGSGKVSPPPGYKEPTPPDPPEPENEFDALTRRFQALKKR